ncbi:MAG TPA: PDDEXK nuclease domain-containing protein [Bryobacteraceae bacterium]|nr:PDDEXK nuclease domain-containing protein [Bryobacteraceae bacterium]
MMQTEPAPEFYGALLGEIKERIRAAQYAALRSVNRELIQLYWDIGRLIVNRQTGHTWGRSVVQNLARDLQCEFPGVTGFSAPNLYKMRQFYDAYCGNQNLSPLVREISWTKNLVILERCHDDDEREFYLRRTQQLGWTKNVLVHQIENRTYEKTQRNQTSFDSALPDDVRKQAKLAVKDEYTFDFLELADEHSERQLERAILAKIEPFLLEMGGMFSFVGSQYRLEVDGREFFIDLLLFHRRLRALLAVELKIGDFQPEHIGKMQFYLAVLDRTARLEGENPAIGILICKTKSRTIVEYALKDVSKPIGVATYQIVSALPVELRDDLPGPQQIARLLSE